MKYILDHDYHIHSYLSPCSNNPEQNGRCILENGIKLGYKDICLTDHFWDETVPCASEIWQCNFQRMQEIKPLPTAEGINFHFGCEAEMDRYGVIGVNRKRFSEFEFIIVPLNHLHCPWAKVQMGDFDKKEQAIIYAQRIYNALSQDLPWHKVGIAHLTWEGVALAKPGYVWQDHIDVLNYISDSGWRTLFEMAAERQCGIELNVITHHYKTPESQEAMLRPYRIAKECGCKFYFGSDAHNPVDMPKLPARAEFLTEKLGLTEDDKFRPFG